MLEKYNLERETDVKNIEIETRRSQHSWITGILVYLKALIKKMK